MATLMEKDVLIEVVASTLALIHRTFNFKTHLHPDADADCGRLIGIRNYLYRASHDEVDYDKTLSECKEIKQKYQGVSDGV